MIKRGSRPFWRSVALLLAAAAGWIAWVAWQLVPAPLATELAYRSQPAQAVAGSLPRHASAKPRKNSKQPSWEQLSAEQQMILRPLEQQWDRLPEIQRQRHLATARHYPKMSKQQQERYSSRLLQWSKMTIEQRSLARKRYAEYSRLPKEARREIAALSKEQQAASGQETPNNAQSNATGAISESPAQTGDSPAGIQAQ